jgi:adenine-specific DNA-methyltransferase
MPSAPSLSHPDATSKRKALGAYYTPPELAQALVHWAVGQDTARVLDPSYGDGRFLRAAIDRFRELDAHAPHARVFGSELDQEAVKLSASLQSEVPRGNLISGDFFATDLESWGGERFSAIVGNPPYVRHHLLSSESKRLAKVHARRVGVVLSERADAWAYFCAALLDYLEPKGRLALLLPGAVLHAEYALPLLHALSVASGRVRLIRVQQRLFEEVSERTVVLLIDGRGSSSGVEYREVADIAELVAVLEGKAGGSGGWRRSDAPTGTAVADPTLRLRTRLRWFVSQDVADIWERIDAMADVRRLGDIAKVRIGVVTGANKFFVIDADTAKKMEGKGVETVPIVSRGGWLKRVRWTDEDQDSRGDKPSRLLLIDSGARVRRALREAIKAAEEVDLHKRHHCDLRDPWYCLGDFRAPGLFLPYMGAAPPRLVINKAGATCTNAIHRVDLNRGQPGAGAVAAASWTSLYRLSAELVGRSYGAGVLKLEPNEAVQLRLPIASPGAENLLRIDRTFDSVGPEAAEQEADRILLEGHLGLSADDIGVLREACDDLQHRRCSG